MRLYFIRHAQSINNQLYQLNGNSDNRHEDPELSDTGKQQAKILATFLSSPATQKEDRGSDYQDLSGFQITHIYSSLMMRAVQTSHAIAEQLGLPLMGWIDLHEEGGIYLDDPETGNTLARPGKSCSFFHQYYPRLVVPDGVTETGWWGRLRETEEHTQIRTEKIYKELLSRHGGTQDYVMLVSHGGLFDYFMKMLFGLSGEQRINFTLNNASITRIDFDEDIISLIYQNRLDFMPRNLIT
jgi:2,3-bisphosphoglycerate-dependent phosphoglycerate mutase